MNHKTDRFIFPGVGAATGAVAAATAAFALRTLLLITVTQNTWISIGPAAVAAKNTGLLVTPSTPIRTFAAPTEVVSFIEDSGAGNISVVQIDG